MPWFWAVHSFLNVLKVLIPLPTSFASSFYGWVELVGLEVCGELGPRQAGRGPGSGSGGLANRSGPQSGSFNHGSMVTWNLYLYVNKYYQCEFVKYTLEMGQMSYLVADRVNEHLLFQKKAKLEYIRI